MDFVLEAENLNESSEFQDMPASNRFGQQADMFETNNKTLRNRRSAARSNVATSFSDIEFVEPRKPASTRTRGPKVEYIKGVKKSRRKTAKSTGSRKFQWTWSWANVGWVFCAFLLLRLVFMERGLIYFHQKDQNFLKLQENLALIQKENSELINEIYKIKNSPRYQKKIARDHLGVIAKGEYLILFAGEK